MQNRSEYSNKSVVFVTGSLSDGGAEKVLSILASQMSRMNVKVSVVILRERKRTYQLSDQVKCYQIKDTWKQARMIGRIVQLRHILKNEKNSTIIPFLPIISLYTMVANLGIGHKIILSERGDPRTSVFVRGIGSKDFWGSLLMRRMKLFNLCDYMVFQTPDAQAYYGESLRKKSCVIPNPLDTAYLPEPFKGERNKDIVAAGRFSEVKNFPMLLRAFAEFHKEFPEYKLTIYGEGSLRGSYEVLARELGIDHLVDMPGFVGDISERIVRAGMYISTSNHEGISNSMLEALGMGIPTIVTDCPVGGARMFVHTNENGILIPMNDVDALVAAMKKVAGDKEYAQRISMNAIRIREEISAENICKQWLELI